MKKIIFIVFLFLISCLQDTEIKTTHGTLKDDPTARMASDPPTCNSGVWYQQNNILTVNPVYVLDTDFYVDLYAYISPSIGGTWMNAPMSITWSITVVAPSDSYPSGLTLLNVTGANSYSMSGSFASGGTVDITFNVTNTCPLVSGPGYYHHIKFYHKFAKLLGGPPNDDASQLTAEITNVTGGSHTIGTYDYGMGYVIYKRP